MTKIKLEVLDAKGNRVGSLTSQDGVVIEVDGPIENAHAFAYHQRGNVLDKEGELDFTVPLHVARNDALASGNHVKIYEDEMEMGEYVITTSSETLSANGREAQFQCPDLMDELRRISVSSGFVADAGHNNLGPTDPVPTRPPETLARTYTRLLGIRASVTGDPSTGWALGDTTTMPTNLDGLTWAVGGISLVEAVGKLSSDKFSHYRLGPGRSVSIGRFGQDSGIRLVGNVRTPYLAQENPELRLISTFQRTWDGNYVNDIVPRGTGNGSVMVTLQPLYSLWGAFTGSDPRFPIKRRLRWDFGGVDGYDYYIDTANFNDSITRYGLSQAIYDQPSIGPTTPITPDSLTQAAMTLYQTAIAHLQWYHEPHETISVVTDGRGDLRDIAGKLVWLVYRELDSSGGTLRDIRKQYFVMEVKRAWSDAGVAQDTWTLSSLGRFQQDAFTVFSGALQQLDYFRTTPTVFPTRETIYYDALIDAIHPASVYLDQDNSVVGIREATFTVTCLPAIAPVTSTATGSIAGAHFHQIIGGLPTNGTTASPVDHGAAGGQYAHGHGSSSTQGAQGITASSGQFSHTHGGSTVASGGGTVGNGSLNTSTGVSIGVVDGSVSGSNPLMTKKLGSTLGLWAVGAGGATIATSIVLDASNTTHSHGSSVPATGGGVVSGVNNGGFTPTTNGYQGFQPSVDQGATSASGGGFAPSINAHAAGTIATFGAVDPYGQIATAYTTSTDGAHVHQMAYGYYSDPSGTASGVTIQVGSVRVDNQFSVAGNGYAPGPYNGVFIVDLNVLGVIPIQGNVRVDFYSATFGRLLIRGRIRRLETTVAAHS